MMDYGAVDLTNLEEVTDVLPPPERILQVIQ